MPSARLSRRAFLGAGAAAFVAACSDSGGADNGLSAPSTDAAPSTTAPAATATTAPTTAPPGTSAFVVAGPSTPANVALTFHTDGDLALLDDLLGVLAGRTVPVPMTAFIVGQWLDANPTQAARLVDAGHELANHTYTHPSFPTLSEAAMTDEIVRCRDVLTQLTGTGGSLFRPSGTADGTETPSPTVLDVAGAAGYPVTLGFGVDPFDYQDPGADAVVERTLAAVAPGAVVSLHCGHPGTITALPTILDGLDERGLTPVTASALLS
jgi:peptidoglycan/xylan/chitin deacetylase (PgdA/CDA1 family)